MDFFHFCHFHLWMKFFPLEPFQIIKRKCELFAVSNSHPTDFNERYIIKLWQRTRPRKHFQCENFQAPTQATMFILLGMLAMMRAAHAEESGEIILHNDDALSELSVVRNWTLICEQLCR
jgi:hypothetical protein